MRTHTCSAVPNTQIPLATAPMEQSQQEKESSAIPTKIALVMMALCSPAASAVGMGKRSNTATSFLEMMSG